MSLKECHNQFWLPNNITSVNDKKKTITFEIFTAKILKNSLWNKRKRLRKLIPFIV